MSLISGVALVLLILVALTAALLMLILSQRKAEATVAAAATPSNPKGPLIAKGMGTAAIVLFVYLLPSLMKNSMLGKAILAALGAANAGWHDWVWWASAGIIAGWILLKIWGKKDSQAGETSSGWLLGVAALAVVIGLTALVTHQATKESSPSKVTVPFPTRVDKLGIGRTVVTGGYGSTYLVNYAPGPANTGQRWGVCIRVTHPRALPFAPIFEWGQPGFVQTVRFSQGSQDAATRHGDAAKALELTFEYVLVRQGQNPCEVIMMVMAG